MTSTLRATTNYSMRVLMNDVTGPAAHDVLDALIAAIGAQGLITQDSHVRLIWNGDGAGYVAASFRAPGDDTAVLTAQRAAAIIAPAFGVPSVDFVRWYLSTGYGIHARLIDPQGVAA